MDKIQFKIKRLIDIVLSFFGIIILLPILLIISLLIYFKLGSPIFFIQKRSGKNEKKFNLIKFRTMLNARDKNENLLSDEKRLTPLGEFLRSASLDEFSELINVLKGDMSLVGPRPLLKEYLPLYSGYHAKRHEVRFGKTDLRKLMFVRY